ncbi:SMI1/KNR4 family protein [Listeria costaricensis]|uniref:SMI1/KNR4 family protein n=1 Tax=Listeria costaricensis TaxID=2026604 RepID=UPI000C08147E|nr:SMI1/KNR4 family protein [Listeria costaricensis]
MKSVHELIDLLQALEKEIDFFTFTCEPVEPAQITRIEQQFGITINADLKTILTHVGCTTFGFNDMSWSWIEASNQQCRLDYQDAERSSLLKDGFIFSDDGAGNQIVVKEDGALFLLYHDEPGYVQMEGTIHSTINDFYVFLRNKRI